MIKEIFSVNILAANPAIDVTYEMPGKLAPGKLRRAEKQVMGVGGKGIIAAETLALLGIDHKLYTFAGGGTGELLKEKLAKDGVNLYLSETKAETRISTRILSDAGMTTIAGTGGRIRAGEYMRLTKKIDEEEPDGTVCFLLAGKAPDGVDSDSFATFIKRRGEKFKTVLYCDGPELRLGLRQKPWLAFLTGKAIVDYLQYEAKTFDELHHAARRIYAETGSSVICRTEKSEYVYCGDGGFMSAAMRAPERHIATIGDGDVFLAVFLWIYIYSGSLEAAMRCAVSAADAKAKLPGAEMPPKEALLSRADEVEIKEYKL